MSESQNPPAIKQEDQKEEEKEEVVQVNHGNTKAPAPDPKTSPRSVQQPSVLSKRSTLSIDEIITGVGHDRRAERSGSRIKHVEQIARGSNADIETVIEEAHPSLQVQVTSRSAKNRKSPRSNRSGPSESKLSKKSKKQKSKVQVSGTGIPKSERDSQTNANIDSKSCDKSQQEVNDQIQETSRSSNFQAQPLVSSPFKAKTAIRVQDFKTGVSRAQAHEMLPQQQQLTQDLQMMSQKEYQIFLKNKLTWNSSHVNKTFNRIPDASAKSTEKSYRNSIEFVGHSQDSMRMRINNDSLLSNKKEGSAEKVNQNTFNILPLEKIVKNGIKAQYSQRGPEGGQDMIYPQSNRIEPPSTLGRSATNDLTPNITQTSVAKVTGSEVVDENLTNFTMVRQSISPGHTTMTVNQNPPPTNIQAFVGQTHSMPSQQSQGLDELYAPASKNDNLREDSQKYQTNPENPFTTIQVFNPSSKAVGDNFKEFNKFAKLLPIDRLDSNQKTLVLTHLALESQRSQLIGRNRLLNEVMRGQYDNDAAKDMNEILSKHNNDELALENYVKKRITQPKSFVEVAKIKDQLSSIRGQAKTQGVMRGWVGTQSNSQTNSIQAQRMFSQGKPDFHFKPKLSLYATNNSFTTAVPTQRGRGNQLSYRLQLQTPKSNFLSGEQSCTVPVGFTVPSIAGTTAVNSPTSQIAARQMLRQGDLRGTADTAGAIGLGASLSSQYRRNKGQQAASFKGNQYHKKYDISDATPLMEELLMSRAGSKKMCQRELRNMQKVMLKTRIANKPKYLWGATDLGELHGVPAQGPSSQALSSLVGVDQRGPYQVGQEGQEAFQNLAFSERTKDSLYQVEDSARSCGPEHPTGTEATASPFVAARAVDPKQKVLSQQQEARRSGQPLSLDHSAHLRTAKNADLGGLDPKLSHLARDWGFHQDAATLGSIMTDKTQRSKAYQGPVLDPLDPSDLLGHSINLKMLRALDEKEPANISYMCMQMKQKFLDEKRLKTQKNTVRALAHKLEKYKKENNHIMVRRDYQYKTVTFKNKWDLMLPNDDVYNGGYSKKYQLLKSPNAIAQQFQSQVSQNFSSERERFAFQSMEHPSHLTETERIIRYEAAKMANAEDLAKIPGSSLEQASALDAMYENYFDAAKGANIADFGLMKTVDKCLESRLNRSRQGKALPEDKLAIMAREVEKSRAFKTVTGAAVNTNQMLMNALYTQNNASAALEDSSSARNPPFATKGDASHEYSDAEASQHNMMTALLPPGGGNESSAAKYCYYKRAGAQGPASTRGGNQGKAGQQSPRLAGLARKTIAVQDHGGAKQKQGRALGPQDRSRKVRVVLHETPGQSLQETTQSPSEGDQTRGSLAKPTPAERITALARHRHLEEPEPRQGQVGPEVEKPSSAGKSETGSPSTEYKPKAMAPPVSGSNFNQSLYSFKKAEGERPGALAIDARQIPKPNVQTTPRSRQGKVSTTAINNQSVGTSPDGRNVTQGMRHYLSHGGKESTLYGEAVSSASKPASQPMVTGESPTAEEPGTRRQGSQNHSAIGHQRREPNTERSDAAFTSAARNAQSSQSPRPLGLVQTQPGTYAQIKDLQRPLLMSSPPAPSNALSQQQHASAHFGGGSLTQSQILAQAASQSGTTSPGFGPASLKRCYLIKPNESSSQRQNNTMVGRSVMNKKLQEAKSKQERLERQQRTKRSSIGAQGRESGKELSSQGKGLPHDWGAHQHGLVGERLGSGGAVYSDAVRASGTNLQDLQGQGSNLGSAVAAGSQGGAVNQEDDIKSKEWGQLGLKTYEMQVMLSTSGSRTSQKALNDKAIPKESSQGSARVGTSSQRRKDNGVNVYPPGQGRTTPPLATPISKGEQSIGQPAIAETNANENFEEGTNNIQVEQAVQQ